MVERILAKDKMGVRFPLPAPKYSMNNPEEKCVYHGSSEEFDSEYAIPRPNRRTRLNKETGEQEVIFDQESFHATPHKWIALAYTYKSVPLEIDGQKTNYNMGVSLYENIKKIAVIGVISLEDSLEKLYGKGGYLYHFNKDKFLYKEGLGPLEVIIEEPTKPILVEKIDDPVSEMEKEGVTFTFIDLALSENKGLRG